jgi:hypothetical protein
LTITRADQCPYTVKNVREISETAKEEFGLKPNIVNLLNCQEAQNSPCAFGIFCIIFNGKLIAHYPKNFESALLHQMKIPLTSATNRN